MASHNITGTFPYQELTTKLPNNGGDSEDNHAESTTFSLLQAKIIAMLVLGIGSIACGLLPIKLASWKKITHKEGIISFALCFGGGVLLFTTFLHLQPEVREGFDYLQQSGQMPNLESIHISDLVFCAGFFFVYLVEELVHFVLDRRSHELEDEAVLHRTMSLRRCSRHPTAGNDGGGDAGTIIPRVSLNNSSKKMESLENAANGSTGSSVTTNSTHDLLNSSSASTIVILDNVSTKAGPLDAELHMAGGPLDKIPAGKRRQQKGHFHGRHSHGHSHVARTAEDDDDLSIKSSSVPHPLRGLLAVLALSFHAVFEGLAVGLESSVGNVWYLLLAIATHKFVIACCVGFELVSSQTKRWLNVVYVVTFAIVTPIGIAVGIAFSELSVSNLAIVILQGMAAGTLMYVIFFEVLQRERSNTQSGMCQLVAIVLGFSLMLGLQQLSGHHHHHELPSLCNITEMHEHDHHEHDGHHH